MAKNKIIAGNWKMNGDLISNDSLLSDLKTRVKESNNTIIVVPPFIYLEQVSKIILGSNIQLGAQDLSAEEQGAFTGDISGKMLKDIGCTYVLVGHSERRVLHGETNQIVAKKFLAAKKSGLIPILCVGESEAERKAEKTELVIEKQINDVIDLVGIEQFEHAIIAYEPVWAIGTGLTATPDQAEAVHEFIYYTVTKRSDTISRSLNVLYGGSVKAQSAKDLFLQEKIDGALVGGASLDSKEFAHIVLGVM